MNKLVISATILIVVGVIGFTAYSLKGNEDTSADIKSSQEKTMSATRDDSATADTATPKPVDGEYVEYSSTTIEETDGVKLLFFHAPWCSQCRAIESDIESQGVPQNTTVLKVDYDTNQELRKKYGVTLQTTFVKIDDDGNEIDKYVAYDQPTFDRVKTNLL